MIRILTPRLRSFAATMTLTAGFLAAGCAEKPAVEQEPADAAATAAVGGTGTPSAAEHLDADYRHLPEAELTERNGKPLRLADLEGNVWVANFVFTRCSGPCPTLSLKMSELQKALNDREMARLVTFSVDPEYDTPERLRAYAESYGADPERWLFVTTGDKGRMFELAMRGFALSAGEDTLAGGKPRIFHDERFVVIDRTGGIRGYFDSGDGAWKEKVVRRVDELLAEPQGEEAITQKKGGSGV